MMSTDSLRKIYLGEELRNAIRLIKLGFGEIQGIGLNNDFYHLPFQLLSSGIERFLKCYICFGYYEKNNRFPEFNVLKRCGGANGHDIGELKKVILRDYFQLRSENDFFLKNDLVFLQDDQRLNELLYLLSEFGKYARYHNLDIVTGKTNPSIDTKKLWEEFETKILKENTSLFRRFFNLNNINNPETYDFINSKIISVLERFVRALSRQFTFVNLGELAKQHSGEVFDFLLIKDDDLGKSEYRKITKHIIETTKKPYERTMKDNEERESNPNHVYKKIRREDFEDGWPFYNEEVIIECRYGQWCVVTIDEFDYALNGSASDKFKLELVNDSGMVIKGIPTHNFIQLAMNLDKTQ